MLTHWPDYRNFAQAFLDATGLSLALVPAANNVTNSQLHDHRNTKLCRLLRQLPEPGLPCGKCGTLLKKKVLEARRFQATKCPAGIIDLALPVVIGGRHVATLLAGKVFPSRRRPQDWQKIVELAEKYKRFDSEVILAGYRSVPVVSARRLRAACVLFKFFGKTLEACSHIVPVSAPTHLPPNVKRAQDFIHKHAVKRITLSDAAQVASMSIPHFCQIFKQHTGLTFTQYLTRERINCAKIKLRHNTRQVAEVVFACGFESITSFNRAFKRWTNLTPTQYRRSLHNRTESPLNRDHSVKLRMDTKTHE